MDIKVEKKKVNKADYFYAVFSITLWLVATACACALMVGATIGIIQGWV